MTSISGIPFDIEHASVLPGLARSTRAALVLRLHSYLTAGDTVRVSAFQNCPSIVGRITAVSYSSADTNGEAVHPHLNGRALGREESLFKLQLFIINDDSILPTSREWNCVPSKLNRACKGIKEAAPTNATVWISANYLSGVVFLLHADQCISQEYGSVVGRADTYYVRYYASLTNQTQFDLYPLLRDEYNPFVFGDGPLLFTERMNNFIYQMWRMNQQLLTKVGKVGGWVPIKLSLDEDVFNYFKQRLIQVGGDNISITTVGKEMKHGILHHNLSLETTLVSNTKIRIQTLNFEGIDAFKSLISQLIGIGVKRKLQSALCSPLSA